MYKPWIRIRIQRAKSIRIRIHIPAGSRQLDQSGSRSGKLKSREANQSGSYRIHIPGQNKIHLFGMKRKFQFEIYYSWVMTFFKVYVYAKWCIHYNWHLYYWSSMYCRKMANWKTCRIAYLIWIESENNRKELNLVLKNAKKHQKT